MVRSSGSDVRLNGSIHMPRSVQLPNSVTVCTYHRQVVRGVILKPSPRVIFIYVTGLALDQRKRSP